MTFWAVKFQSLRKPMYCSSDQLSNLIKNIFICVPKINKALTGLVEHGGEQLMT